MGPVLTAPGLPNVTTRHHDVIALVAITLLSILFGLIVGLAVRYQLI